MRWLIVLEGVNDFGTLTRDAPASPAEHGALILSAYEQIIDRAHAVRLFVAGGMIALCGGNDDYHPDAASKKDRQTVNAWIRASSHFV